MNLVRLLSAGRSDREAVYERLSAAISADDERMWEQVMSSAVGRAGAALIDVTTRAAAESVAVNQWCDWRRTWSAWSPLLRMRLIGVTLVTAVSTHVLMMPWQGGARRLLLPGLFASFGLIVWSLSYRGPRSGDDGK